MKYQTYIFEEAKTASFYKKAIAEYEKRLSSYCKISCHFIKKEKDWEKLLREAQNAGNACLVLPGPGSMTSEIFSQTIGQWEMSGQGKKCFFISASHFSEIEKNIKKDNKETNKIEIINLSDFTMNTAMSGMILYEQIYRGYRILNHHPYHK